MPPSRATLRLVACAGLLLLPALTAWNLIIAQIDPGLRIVIGPELSGVTRTEQPSWSWPSFVEGSLQKALAARVAEAIPIRPLLIRINNEIQFEVFGELTAPGLIRGKTGHLVGDFYRQEYCARTADLPDLRAAAVIPKLIEIQEFYRARGAVFLYLVTPSKVAHLPEEFAGVGPCPNSREARDNFVPRYVALLQQAGVAVVDAASLVHRLRRTYDVSLFPQGGSHWNDLGGANAVTALVAEIDRQAGRDLVPGFRFSYRISAVTRGVDRELADILNVLMPPLGFETTTVQFQPDADCATHPARDIDAAMVGSSFSHLLAEILIPHDCLARLKVYFYLRGGQFGGNPYRRQQDELSARDLSTLRTARIMIVEENESFVGTSSYIDDLRRLLAGS